MRRVNADPLSTAESLDEVGVSGAELSQNACARLAVWLRELHVLHALHALRAAAADPIEEVPSVAAVVAESDLNEYDCLLNAIHNVRRKNVRLARVETRPGFLATLREDFRKLYPHTSLRATDNIQYISSLPVREWRGLPSGIKWRIVGLDGQTLAEWGE